MKNYNKNNPTTPAVSFEEFCQRGNITKKMLKERWKTLPFSNDFIFCKVMEDNPMLCKKALQLLTGLELEKIKICSAQHSVKDSTDSRGIRLDVYAKSSGIQFDLEIQTTEFASPLLRARYYSACLDTSTLRKGQYFNSLGDVYIIFLCLKDPFKKGLACYSYRRTCSQDTSMPDDRTYNLFYNIQACSTVAGRELRNFLEFIKTDRPTDTFTQTLAEKVKQTKQNAQYRRNYMTLEMKEIERYQQGVAKGYRTGRVDGESQGRSQGISIGRSIGRNQGISIGRSQGITIGRNEGLLTGKIESAISIMKGLGLSMEKAASLVGIPVEKLAQAIKNT